MQGRRWFVLGATTVVLLSLFASSALAAELTPKEELGKALFFDTSLSAPPGMSCGTCHEPTAGFTDPRPGSPTSAGVIENRFGDRSAPSAAYAFGGPPALTLHNGEWVGGLFWDGRADTLEDQARAPFLNTLEMHAPNETYVVTQVRTGAHARLFREVYGRRSLNNAEQAYGFIVDAIAAYERSAEVNPFTSKYDYFLDGAVMLSQMEMMGLTVFNTKGKCSTCHPSTVGADGSKPLFTDHRYFNLGTPKNAANLFYTLPPALNPLGNDYIDYGLGAVLEARGIEGAAAEMGKVKVPTLRNLTKTAPYMHNGVFATIMDVVHFYNMRDVPGATMPDGSPILPPEVPVNVDTEHMGNLGLTMQEGMALIMFLRTLDDGYVPPAP
jgi:cytochrome c peroxidase